MAIAKLINQEKNLQQLLLEKKNVMLEDDDIRIITEKGKLTEYLKDDSDNVMFEYVIKFYAYGMGINAFNAHHRIIESCNLKNLDYRIELYPEWQVIHKKEYIEKLFL
jgi:hypothetical protein